jgi:hypothetical protein
VINDINNNQIIERVGWQSISKKEILAFYLKDLATIMGQLRRE